MPRSSGLAHQRLLPASIEARLIGCLGRAGGFLLLITIAVAWAAVLTWSLVDPSFTHATGGPAQNWLGSLGAIVSDLLLQTVGLATAAVLLAPMFWGIELMASERVTGFGTKAAYFPLSVIGLAAALSALPVTATWPLHHGYGGILGDAIFQFSSALFAFVNPERAGVAAGLLLFITALSTLAHGVGLELKLKDIPALLARLRGPSGRSSGCDTEPRSAGLWQESLRGKVESLGRWINGFAGVEAGNDSTPRYLAARDSIEGERAYGPQLPMGRGPQAEPFHTPIGEDETLERETTFDADTDLSSRSIAQRFAPAGAAPVAAAPILPAPKSSFIGTRGLGRGEAHYKGPSLSSLRHQAGSRPAADLSQAALRNTARALEDVLADFGVKGEVRDIKPGPVVTLFELEPARGTKTSRIVSLADDIARSMGAASARVAVVSGRNAIGIELPNARREQVAFREMLESEAFRSAEGSLPLALGKSISGEAVVADLARMPHLLIAGTTGSGKSVGLNAMILSLLYRHSPDECRLLMIDPKMLELSVYNGIPHLLCPVVTEPKKAVSALNWAVNEMEERYKRMSRLTARNIDAFNARVKSAKTRGEVIARTVQTGYDANTGQALYEHEEINLEPMPYIVVVVDEFADLMIASGKEIETAVQRLAQKARAAGIHLIMATQRPSVDVITGTIKANFPTRISFKVASKIDSRTILNEQGAEQLLGHGDMLYAAGAGQLVRIHGPLVSDEEVESIAQSLREHGGPRYVDGIGDMIFGGATAGADIAHSGEDDLFSRAAAVVLRDRKASTSHIQRRLSIGYNRAADLMERLELEGLVSAPNHMGRREVLGGDRTGFAASA